MALSNNAINFVLQALRGLMSVGQGFTACDVRNAADHFAAKRDDSISSPIDHDDVLLLVRCLHDQGFLGGFTGPRRVNLDVLITDTYDPVATPEVPTNIVPSVNLGGQVVITGGNGSLPPPAPPPSPLKPVSSVQLDSYLNTWNKPETRTTASSGEGLLMKLKSTLRDLLS
jgi:hypothetical protein